MTFSGRVFKQQKGSAQTNHGGSRTAPAPIHPQAQRGARCLARDTNARATSSFSVIAQRAQKRVLIGISIDRRNIINPHRPGADRTRGPIHFQRCRKLLRSIIRHALPSLVLVTPSIRRFRWLLHPRTISNLPAPLRAAQAEELRYCIAAKP